MSNLSRLRHTATRSARQAAYSIRQPRVNTNAPTYNKILKRNKTLLEYALTYGDLMLIMDVEDILPRYYHGDGTVHNDRFPNKRIQADKIGLIYSQKKKLYMYLSINDNYTCNVLFEEEDVYKLPNIKSFDIEHLNPNWTVCEKANRVINTVYTEIWNWCSNPILLYKTSELFKK